MKLRVVGDTSHQIMMICIDTSHFRISSPTLGRERQTSAPHRTLFAADLENNARGLGAGTKQL